jgi:alpha-1,2-mannosyltransferase
MDGPWPIGWLPWTVLLRSEVIVTHYTQVVNTFLSSSIRHFRTSRTGFGRPWFLFLATFVSVALQLRSQQQSPSGNRFADLQVYRGAAKSLLSDKSLYDFTRFNGDVFTYPPIAGYLLVWTALPEPLVENLWAVISLFAILGLAYSLAVGLEGNYKQVKSPNQRLSCIAGIALLLSISAPGRSNLAFGQISLIIVSLTVLDLVILQNSPYRGILLGIGIAVKLTPLLFLPLLWLGGRRRQTLVATATAFGLTGLAAILDPPQSSFFWLRGLTDNSKFVNSWIPGNQSLRAVLERSGYHHNNLWLGLASIFSILGLVVALRLLNQRADFLAFGTIGACTIIVSPISWTHHQFWILMPALWATMQALLTYRIIGGLLLVAMVAGSPSAAGAEWWQWPLTNLHFLTAAICLIFAAFISRRQDFTEKPA